ncbi:hypothetical protein WJX84_012141 [Apatococcus fuscideae]|uniref:RNA helicase n=1 Tax=Apatococcus fuscideae TaxID=2026836 RepID=A0AAW1SLR1_9CHLO
MGTFLRPGQRKAAAFGVSFDTDRDTSGASAIIDTEKQSNLLHQRKRLPVTRYQREILYLLEKHGCTVLVGETGCGKTTQVPQMLLEAGWAAGGRSIACTQPRRVAAITVAARVADEQGCTLGREVGYKIRFEDVSTSGVTKLKYCTDGSLLREMMDDPLLTAYSVVMVDEAHERSLSTDLLLGLLRKVLVQRPDLRILISSASLEAEKVAGFYDARTVKTSRKRPHQEAAGNDDPATALTSSDPGNGKPADLSPAILSVEGRLHPVQVHYLDEPCSDYVVTAIESAVNLHRESVPGDILIFLTGQEECERAVTLLEEEAGRLRRIGGKNALRIMPLPLFAGLPAAQQALALEAAPRNYRKVVAATNVAETSLTLEGVTFVIDACHVKQKTYNPRTGLEALLVAPISQASAQQRAGRAGRVRPGHCLRLCTQEAFSQLQQATVPEMQRSELAGTVLQLKALGIDNMMRFHWLAPPPAEAMVRALELLHSLGALDDDARLSKPVGCQMAELPLEPRLAATLLAAVRFGCGQEIATICALLSVHSVWASGGGQRKAMEEAQSKFATAEGDLVTYLNVWKAWEDSGRNRKWAERNLVSQRVLLRAADIRNQLLYHLRSGSQPICASS